MFGHHLGACRIRALGKGLINAGPQLGVQRVTRLDDSRPHHTGDQHRDACRG